MSRHRNIHNLTDDDYYDYDDDYYDEEEDYDDNDNDNGYTQEENDAYYREQERLYLQQQEKEQKEKKEKEAKKKSKSVNVKKSVSISIATSKGTIASANASSKKEALFLKPPTSTSASTSNGNGNGEAEKKERLAQTQALAQVTSMGFSSQKAKLALERNAWDVQKAINDLLTAPTPNYDNDDDNGNDKHVDDKVKVKSKVKSKGGKSSVGTNSSNSSNSNLKSKNLSKTVPPPGFTKPKPKPKVFVETTHKKAFTKKGSTGGVGVGIGGIGVGGVGGIVAPPPGWGRPDTVKNVSASNSKSKTTSASTIASVLPKKYDNINPKSVKPAATVTKINSNTSTSTNTNTNTRPKKKLPKDLQQKIKQQKSRLSMVILGHVDAGKSTLMGQVLVQLGIVQKRIVNKYQKQAAEIGKASFALAWVMDEDESERERGVTIDIATKHISTDVHDLTILDAPGHADYVPAMITGAASADVGILVVAATPGEFESGFDNTTGSGGVKGHVGQTREHITLARGLGVSQLIVAVNKLDAAEPSWSRDRFIEIRRRLVPFLKSNGFDMKRVQFVPTSGLSGVNVKIPPSANDGDSAGLASWYNESTLLQAINKFEPAKRNIDKPFRFLASDIYSEGKFVIVKGRVVQGLISVGDKIVVLPVGDDADVGRIEHGVAISGELGAERMNIAMAGDSVELYLVGIDIARMSVGNIISDVDENSRPKLRRKMRAKIIVMDRLTVPIIRGSQVLMHMHSLDVPAVISNLISQTNRDNSLNSRPRVLTGGANATVEIKLSEKICLEPFSECRALGRFALRRGGDTVAVGIVEATN